MCYLQIPNQVRDDSLICDEKSKIYFNRAGLILLLKGGSPPKAGGGFLMANKEIPRLPITIGIHSLLKRDL